MGKYNVADFVTLTCPSCGGKLQITNDLDRFACGFCGTEHIVKRTGGVVALSPVVEGLRQVRVGVDKTASELAIARLKQEIAGLNYEYAHVEESQSVIVKQIRQLNNGVSFFFLFLFIVLLVIIAAFTGIQLQCFAIIALFAGIMISINRFRNFELTNKLKDGNFDARKGLIANTLSQKANELRRHEAIVRH